MIDLYIACAAAGGFTKASLLSALLTTEGLLFAALSVSVSLAGASPFGSKTVVPPAALAFMASGVLLAVAAAAVLAWTDLFLGARWPGGWNARLQAGALLFAIVGQPVVALSLALGVWRG